MAISPIVQNYVTAARLGSPSIVPSPADLGSSELGKGRTSTSSEVSSFSDALTKSLKQTGGTAEAHLKDQIMGVGNTEKVAVSLHELSTHLEIVSQALRISIEKLNELTTRTMGG